MKFSRWLSALLIIIIVIGSLGFIKFNQIQAMIEFGESFPEPSASVKSTYVKPISHTQTTKVIGEIHATQYLTVSNEYPGSITFVGFKPGEQVAQSQVLLKLDTQLEEANLAAANARLTLAQSTYQRLSKLLSQKRISQDEVDKAIADVAITKAEVANINSIIDKKTIRAPFAGHVSLDQYQVGQLLDANSQITTLVGLDDTIWVDFSVPQSLPLMTIGDSVNVSVNGENAMAINATIIAKTPSIDAQSRQQGYRALIKNQNKQFSHNQMVTVYVPTQQLNALVVPTNAITRSHFGHFVYRLTKDEQQNWRAEPTQVTLGNKIGDQQIILSGLSEGEFIASEGAFKLKEKMLVYTTETAELMTATGVE